MVFKEKSCSIKKRKTSNFYSPKSFSAQKKFVFCGFLFAYFGFGGCFCHVLRFLCSWIFLKNIRNCPDNLIYCTTNLIYYTTDAIDNYFSTNQHQFHTYLFLTCVHLFPYCHFCPLVLISKNFFSL